MLQAVKRCAPNGRALNFDRLKPGAYLLCLRRNGAEVWLDVAITNGASEL